MSVWTHVAGVVRYDLINVIGIAKEPEFHQYKWSDSDSKRDACNVPLGSEGSLTVNKHDVYRNKNQAFITYSFSGDLRDYGYEDDHVAFEKWLASLIPNDDLVWISQAVFQVHYEDRDGLVTYQFDQDSNKFEAGELL